MRPRIRGLLILAISTLNPEPPLAELPSDLTNQAKNQLLKVRAHETSDQRPPHFGHVHPQSQTSPSRDST